MEVPIQSSDIVLNEEIEGELIIDEGKKPAKAQRRKVNGEKATSSAAAVGTPPAPMPQAFVSSPEPTAANEPEMTSRSGRKIKPKR